ncbi:MAG TPA: choice-of-anchor D domain-containing protein, partial [Pirellulales bacterium]|nr:choice-of-anchor D domain-containing protein [Pirellulales bacterium]
MRPNPWNDFLRRISIAPAPCRRRRRTGRTAALQSLEPRELLTASMELFNGSTQLYSSGGDSFGTVSVGAADTQYLTVKNVGSSTLTISSDSLPSGFSSSTSMPLSINAGQSATLAVSMSTGSPGSFSGPFQLSTNDPNNSTFMIYLSGTVQQSSGGGTIELFDGSTQLSNGGSDSFGSVTVGSSDTKSFTVDNTGSSSLSVSSVNLPSGYTLNTSLPLTIAPNQSSTLTVSLNTSTAGTYGGTMSVTSNSTQNNPFSVSLSGTVTAPAAPVMSLADGSTTIASGGNDSFGDVTQGSTANKTFTVKNTGNASLSVSAISLPSGYSLQTSLPLSVAAGGSTTFVVALNTGTIGTYSGTMSITDTDSNNDPYNVSLSGTVQQPSGGGTIELLDGSTQLSSGASDSFGNYSVGANAIKQFTVKDTGTQSLNVSQISLPNGFSLQSTPLPLNLSPGGSAMITVMMNTSTAGNLSGTMTIDSNDPNSPFTLNLNGSVGNVSPVITVYDGSTAVPNNPNGGASNPDDFGDTPLGTPLDKTFTIANSGSSEIAITAASLRLPPGFSFVGSWPATVSAHGSVPFTVQFDSTSAGTAGGVLSFEDGDPAATVYQFGIGATATVPHLAIQDQSTEEYVSNGLTDAFGTTEQGVPVEKTFVISNISQAPLLLAPTSLMLPTGFSLVGNLPATVAAGGTASFTLELNAAAAGSYSGTMSFLDNDLANTPFSLTLTGVVNAPTGVISVSDGGTPVIDGRTEIDFGTTNVGTPASQSFLIRNTGQAALSLDPQTLLVPAGFSVAQTFDGTLAPGASTTLVIDLSSGQAGAYGGTVSFHTGDPNHPVFTFFAGGQVNPPEPAVAVLDGNTAIANGANDNFGSTPLGTPIQQTITIENQGNAELNINLHSLVAPTGFGIVTPPAATVEPGGSTSMVVELDAAEGGNASGTLTFASNDPNNAVFSLNVSGQVLVPAMAVSNSQGQAIANNTGTLNFGSTPLSSPTTSTITIRNTGSEDLSLDPNSLTLPQGYSLVSAFASDVPPDGSTSLTIQFDATSIGQVNGQVVFHDSDPNNSPFSFAVTATAATPAIEVLDGSTQLVQDASDDFGSTTIGTPVEQTLTINNTGLAPLVLQPSSIIAPTGFSVVTPFASQVAPGSSTTLVVELNAASAGNQSGLLTFVSNDPITPVFKLQLSGQVLAPSLEVRQAASPSDVLLTNGASISLGTTTVGDPVNLTLLLGDAGAGALTLSPSSLSVPAGFSVVQTFAPDVASQSATELIVALAATAVGSYSGSLSFTSNDATQSPFTLSVSGIVNAPTLEVLDGSTIVPNGGQESLGQTPVGTPIERTLTIQNESTNTLTIDTANIMLPAGYALATPPAATIAAGASSNMVVELNAAAAGLYTGTFTLPTSDPNFPDYRITLNGTALAPPPNMALTDALAGTPIANGGSLGFGSSPQYTPVYKIISIENTTGSTIMLDPSTLVVPAGFSVFQAFDSSVAAGNSTALGLQLDAQAAGNDSGTVSFNYNDGVPETCSFTVSGTVTAPEPQDISLDQVELPNNIGPRAAETTADPTISGVVDGTFNGGSVVVQFDTRGNGTPDGATATITQSGTTFSFDPRSVNSSLVGYVGPVDVKYRTKITDSAGNVTYGAWTDFPFTMVVPSTQAHVDDLDLANNTGGSADDTYDPRVSGHVGGPFVGATVDVQFVVGDGSGNPGGLPPANPTITGTVDNLSQPGQTFTYDPVTDDTALVNYAGPVQLSYRTVEYDIAGNVVATGAWTTFGFTLYVPTPQASVSNFHLVDDTGTSNTDNVTSDPTVAGTVTGTFTNEVVEVQFSHHGDGHIDGLVAVTAVGTDFTYDPRESDPTLDSYSGPLPLEYRTVEFDQQGGEVVGAWTSFPITLLLESTSAVIDNLRLTDVTGAAGPPPTTDDPTVTGSVAGMQQSGIPKVQFDYNGDGIPDETATANSDGSFSDSLPGLAYGNVTIAARAVEFDPANGVYLYGAWTTLSFDYLPPPPPAISSLVLANVTDSGTGGTSDPTVKGTVAVGNASGGLPVEVQFDTTGSGQPDGQALADTQGNFSFTPIGLDYGTVTIAARTVEHGAGPLAYSPWLSLTFTYEPPPADAPTVQDFRLANPNLGSSSIAADPTVTGTVTFDNLAAGSAPDSLPGVPSTADMMSRDVSSRTVQFDTTGDGTPTASTATGPGGTFTFKPTGLAYGQVTIRARAVGVDSQGNPVYGDWTSLTFTYQQPPSNLATVSSLVLASPLPQVVGPGLSQTASDPTVNGQLAAPSGQTNPNATAFLAVEFDTNAGNESGGNYAPNATVQADANGNFTFTPTGLSYGPVTIAARVRQHDYTTGGFDYSAWTTLSFTYQAPTVTAASVTLSLVDNSGASGHTANPALKGTVTQGSGQNGTNGSSFIQISTTGNGVPDATVFPDANGNFAYTPADLAYGPTTIEARAVGWTSSGSGGYTYGPWTSLSFTYEQEAYAAPVLAALGLVDSDGNLNTQVNSSTTTAQPVVGGQLTYQGSVQGLTVEFAATNGGTPYASVTTDQYGNFSYVPTGLTPGEVTIYARTVSSPLPLGAGGSGAGSVLIGPWTPLTFTYVAPTVAPPTISGFTLASPLPLGDSGSSGLTATDPTVTGTASVGAALSGAASSSATHLLVIQFDTNGDGAPDATTVADSSGSFAWTPATLSPGQVTIQARAVDDDANGNAIYGSWVSLSFTLQAVAPSAGTIIGSLALSDNVGPSSTALVSSDGSISGQVVDAQGSTASTSGVTVEIDLADGGQPTATVTTDAQGNFSYTPPTGSLPEGAVTIQVRTVDQAAAANLASSNASGPAGGTYDAAGTATFSADASGGDWTSISFVLSSNPTNSSVQNQATTLAANLAAAALAASNDQSTNSSAASALAASAAASAGAYNTGVAKADADQQTSAAAAAAAYDAALASAQETYDAAMSQASGNFNSELASYSGDRTSYDSQPYQWPDAPPALPGPDETPATPPVQPPTFTGPQFDPAQDPAYSAAIAADQQAYDTAVEDAEGTYDSDVNDAATTQKNSVNAARDVERQAFAAADQQYQTALAAPNPTDLTSAAAAAHTAYQAAHDTYATAVIGADVTEWEQINAAQAEMVAASEAAQLVRLNAYAADLVQLGNTLAGITPPPPNLTGDALNAAGVAYGHEITQAFYTRVVSDAGADLTFATTVDAAAAACGEKVDAAIAEHDKAVSAAMAAELTAFDAANLTYLTAAAEWHRWDAQNRADADKIRQESYDQAEYNYGTAVALAAQTYSDSVALARQTRDDSIADALLTQQQDDAQTLAEAADNLVSGGSGGSGSSDPDTAAWNQYQATLALDESQYEESDASAQHTLSYEEDAAAYDDAIGVDLANLTRDETIALDKRTEKDTEAGAQDTLLVGQAANDKQRTVDDDTASKDANDAYADAEDAFDQAAIGYLKDLDDNVGKNTQAATDAFAGVVYDMAICTDPTSTVIAQFAAERQSIAQSLLTDNAQDIDAYIHNLVKSDLTRGTELTTTEDSLAGGLSSDMCDWLQQNDELLGIDEKDVGAALATQDEDDTGARDEADAQAANLAKIELDTDAPNEQAYDDNQATEQQTQDVADTEAQQGFEESEADNYVSQLDTWVQSLPTGSPLIASATEQYQQAQADDQWVHDATAAEVADVQAEDEAQVTWADAVDQQSEEQTADDAAAMAAAITASDDADAQRATTDDAAWTTEVQKLADVTTTYDQANALATSKLATSDADALETARDAWDAALGAQINTWADVMMNATISGDASGVQSQIAAANLTQLQAQEGASVTWADTCAGDQATYMKSLADAKGGTSDEPDTGWVAGITDAEAAYVAAAATAGAVETQSDAEAAAGMDETLALDEGSFEVELGDDNNTLDSSDGADQETLVHAEDECDAADEVGYAQANATYQDTLWSSYAGQLATAAAAGDPATAALAQYYASVALHQSQEISTDGADLVGEVNELTQADIGLADEEEAASVDQAADDDAAMQTETTTLVPQEEQAVDDADGDLVQAATEDSDAQAAYETSVADAVAQFYKDKAAASRLYDYAAADAGVALVTTMAPHVADYVVQSLSGQPITEDLGADGAAAIATYDESIHGALEDETTSYGDAEVAEATSIGEAQVALATSQGDDEVELTENEAQVSDTLESETLADDDTLNNAVTGDGETDAESAAGDEADTTSTEGTDEVATQELLAGAEATTAANLAGDQATYAITVAQIAADAAASYAQANPGDGQAQ